MRESSPAPLYAALVGVTLAVAGIVRFPYEQFRSHESVRYGVFGSST